MSFLRSLFAVSLTGASSVGGTLIYQSAVPGSGKDVLIKEGYYLLQKDDEYKAIYEDQKEKTIKKVDELTSIAESSKIKSGCDTELPKPYKYSDREKMINLCTFDGIITVKARLISIGKSSFITDETDTSTQDKQYKTIFSIYRYHERFVNFFQRGDNNEVINSSTDVGEGYTKLKDLCNKRLNQNHKEILDPRYFKNVSGGCSKFEFDTFIKLAKHRNEQGELDETGNNKGNLGKHTDTVKKHVKSSENGDSDEDIDDTKIKNGCNQNQNNSFEDNNNYQEKFVVFMSVCKKTESED